MGKFTEFKVPLKSLPQGEHDFSYHIDKSFFTKMENTDIRNADIDVVLIVTYNGDIYNLDFNIMGKVTLICDRCLDDLEWTIESVYNISVKYGDDYNDDSDTMLEIPYGDNDLNVAYMIYETITLAIPIKHVHPMGKCNRAMSSMLKKHRAGGEDEQIIDELVDEIDDIDSSSSAPIDPRWNALKNLSVDDE